MKDFGTIKNKRNVIAFLKNQCRKVYFIAFGVKNNKIALLLISIFLCVSCQNADRIVTEDIQNKNFVSITDVSQIASQLQFPVESSMLRGTTAYKQKEVKNITPVVGKTDKSTLYYVVNYESGGYIIMAADNRVAPLLAFSDEGKFDLEEKELPGGLIEWFEDASAYMEEIKKSDIKQSGNIARAWTLETIQALALGLGLDDKLEEDGCESSLTQIGPFLSTTWNQGDGYNDQVNTNIVCNNSINGRPPAGCVAIAMAQIMKYHGYPNTYNWNAMPNSEGSPETARLIRNIGVAVSMDYGCSGSGAFDVNAANAFKYTFGYNTSLTISNYDRDRVVSELDLGRPVYLRGGGPDGGHAWVCDGYKRSIVCDCSGGDFGGLEYVTIYLHMNWGWRQRFFLSLDGWFRDDWTVNNTNFNSNKKMIYNIKP